MQGHLPPRRLEIRAGAPVPGRRKEGPNGPTRHRMRASRLLDGLDTTVRRFPDLRAKLAPARAELGLPKPNH